MEIIKNFTIPINLENDIVINNGINYSAVTFDDGFRNIKENALPILEKLKIPSTMFCLASNFGEKPIWDYNPITQDKYEYIMTQEEIKSLPKEIMNVGSHTISHKKLNKVSVEELKYELKESKNILESILSREIRLFSFPNGEYNQQAIKEAFNSGYEKLFTIEPKLSNQNEKVFGRFNADPSDWMIEFRLKLFGYYEWQMIFKKIKNHFH